MRLSTGPKFHTLWDLGFSLLLYITAINRYAFISTHIPRGMWPKPGVFSAGCMKFLLTHPSRDVTPIRGNDVIPCTFLLTHPSRDVTTLKRNFGIAHMISTHTSLAGCDLDRSAHSVSIWISTHTSLAGCDSFAAPIFAGSLNFYSHIPRGMWRVSCVFHMVCVHISTHTSLAGCDMTGIGSLPWHSARFLLTHPSRDVTITYIPHWVKYFKFLLTHPSRDVTTRRTHPRKKQGISTHTSLAGCDSLHLWFTGV